MHAPYSQIPQVIAHVHAQANVCQDPVSCVNSGEGTWRVEVEIVILSACLLLPYEHTQAPSLFVFD